MAVRRDGSPFDVQASVSLVQHGAGRRKELMVFFVDITERKRWQEALRRRAMQAAFLNEIGEKIAAERQEQAVLDRAVELAREAFNFHQVAVLMVDEEQQMLEVAALASTVEGHPHDTWALPLGEGITGWAAQQNRTAVVNDVGTDPRYVRPFPNPVPPCSEMAVPICREGYVLGVLDVQSPSLDAFGMGEQVVMETLADQIAVALENARLYRALEDELARRAEVETALRKSVHRLETFHEIDRAIVGAKSMEEIASAVVQRLASLVPCQRVSVDLFDWEAEEVIVLAAIQTVGEGRAGTGAVFPLTQREWLLNLWESGGIAKVPDAFALPHQASPMIQTVIEDGMRSFITAAIGFGEELIGLLTLGSVQTSTFDVEHEPIIKEMADTLAIAIQQARLFDSVRQQRERLRTTMSRLAEVEETERRRVVRALHDRVGQNLTALDLNLSLMRSQLEGHGLQQFGARLDDSLALVAQTNRRIRQLMIDLRPPVLDDYGLLSALHWYGDRFTARTGIGVEVKGREVVAEGLSPHVENALFRIVQEALNNIQKHAKADNVTVALSSDDAVLRLVVSDDGLGFSLEEAERKRDSWGLLTMRERAESVGARCDFDTVEGEGTRVVVEVPT